MLPLEECATAKPLAVVVRQSVALVLLGDLLAGAMGHFLAMGRLQLSDRGRLLSSL